MQADGMIQDQNLIYSYLEKGLHFGSLFILSRPELEERFVVEIKHLNDGLGQISFTPLDEDLLVFTEGEIIEVINESGNVSFEMKVLKNHGSKWITGEVPKSFRVINLRQCERFVPGSGHLLERPSIISYGEDGRTKGAQLEAQIIDISETGVSVMIKARRIDGLFRADKVEMNLSKKHAFLSRVGGVVVHKSIANAGDKEMRFYKIGVKFKSRQNLAGLRAQ